MDNVFSSTELTESFAIIDSVIASIEPVVITVPVSCGIVIVLFAVGSAKVREVVNCPPVAIVGVL